jgi:hypothetical protein
LKAPSDKFVFFGETTNLGNCKVWTHEKWGTSLFQNDRKTQREHENLPLPQDIVYLASNAMTCNQGPNGLWNFIPFYFWCKIYLLSYYNWPVLFNINSATLSWLMY